MDFLNSSIKSQIGYDFIIDELKVNTCFGREKKIKLKPYNNKNDLLKEFNNQEEIIYSIKENREYYLKIENIISKFKDIRNSLDKCNKKIILDEVEIFEIKLFSNLIIQLKEILDKLNLSMVNIYDLSNLYKILDPEGKNIVTFYIYDAYSNKLSNIRKSKKYLEKLIINESNEDKIEILKQKRLDCVVEEQEEEFKIRQKLTDKISSYKDRINKNIEMIAKLDLWIAKAKLSIKYNGVKPIISDDMKITLKNAVNPYVISILDKTNKKFVPISIKLNSGTTVITGANMGGKSVTLKTITLNVYLANLGFYVFCEYAEIPVVNFIDFLSDDMQCVKKGLSTFGAEIIKLNNIIKKLENKNGFIVLDEFARGTNPQEGCYLVKSVGIYLNKFKSISLFTTHYDNVLGNNMVHYEVKGLKNVDFNKLKNEIDLNKEDSIDVIQEHMDYRLEKVTEKNKVPKDAFNIASLLGMKADIINTAKKFYEKEDSNAR